MDDMDLWTLLHYCNWRRNGRIEGNQSIRKRRREREERNEGVTRDRDSKRMQKDGDSRKRIIRRKFPRRAGETGWWGPAGSYESPVQKEGERGTSRTWSSGAGLGFREL